MSTVASELELSPRNAARRAAIAARLLPLGLVLLVTLVFLPSLVDRPYSHGPLLAAVCVYLLWRDGAGLDLRQAHPSRYALAELTLVMLGWVVAGVAQVNSIEESLWPLASWLVLAATLGVAVARRYLVALGLLYFGLPIWTPFVDAVLWPLAAAMPTLLLGLIGTPVFLDGHVIHVPEGSFEVAVGSSGLHYFLAATGAAVLAAHLGRARWREWLVLVASAAAFAMMANWLRIATVVYTGHPIEMQDSWKILAVMILLYCYAVRRWLPLRAAPLARVQGVRERAALTWAVVFAALPLLIASAFVMAADRFERVPAVFPIAFPEEIAGFGTRRTSTSNDWRPVFIGAARVQSVEYGAGVHRLLAYQNAYSRETPGAKLIFHSNSVTGAGWHTEVERPFEVHALRQPIVGTEVEGIDELGRPWLLRYTYAVGGRFIASPVRVKLEIAAGALVFAPPGRGLIATAIRCATSCDAARRDSEAFWNTVASS